MRFWTRVRLFFKRPIYGFDFGHGDYTSLVEMKVLNGKTYVTREWCGPNAERMVRIILKKGCHRSHPHDGDCL